MSEVRVRGRDFTGYRIAGAITALVLLVLLIIQVIGLFVFDARTVPEVRWGVPEPTVQGPRMDPDAGSFDVVQRLRDRTALQDERFVSGPSPSGSAGTFHVGDDILLQNTDIDNPNGFLTTAWSRPTGDTLPMLRDSAEVIGISSLPYVNANLFERPFARDWRLGMASVANHIGGFAILGFSLLLALMLAIRGRVPIVSGKSGRTVKRFGLLERATHWMTALSFIMLALTGLLIAYGSSPVLPFDDEVLGPTGWLAAWGHMMFFPPFALGIVLMAIMWIGRNLPSRLDAAWLARGGGFFTDSHDHPPAKKFNAGQKVTFWCAFLGGGLLVATGVTLMFPFYWLGLEGMSWAVLIHAVLALLMIAIFIGHIYIGTVGMQGAFWAMWSGRVDRNWAEEHHSLWLEDLEQGREGRA